MIKLLQVNAITFCSRFTGIRVLIILILSHVLISLVYIQFQDITFDEAPYYGYTVRWAHGNMDRVYNWDDSKSPATFPSLSPRTVYQFIHPDYAAQDDGYHDMIIGRYLMCV